MLQRAMLVGYRSGFNTDEELGIALDMATYAGAAVLGIRDYGIQVGSEANFVVLDAPNAAAAVVTVPVEREVYRRGQAIKGMRRH